MLARAQYLARRADQAARYRGHTLGAWSWTHWNQPVGAERTTGRASCTRCEASAHVDSHPPANGIDVSGAAVAINCHD